MMVARFRDLAVDYPVDKIVYRFLVEGQLAGTTTIRVAVSDRDTAQGLAKQTGRSQMEIVHEALELYRRRQLLEDMNEGFAALRRDTDAWDEEVVERDVWDITLGDATGGD
jgi:predicted DNA-binding protein